MSPNQRLLAMAIVAVVTGACDDGGGESVGPTGPSGPQYPQISGYYSGSLTLNLLRVPSWVERNPSAVPVALDIVQDGSRFWSLEDSTITIFGVGWELSVQGTIDEAGRITMTSGGFLLPYIMDECGAPVGGDAGLTSSGSALRTLRMQETIDSTEYCGRVTLDGTVTR
jgi:hypothetical protein